MDRKNKLKDTRRAASGQSGSGGQMTEWFTNHISRRSLGKGLAWGAVLAMAGVTVYKMASKDEPEVSADSLDIQKKAGWDVGSTDKPLTFDGMSATDSRGNPLSAVDPNYLISVYQPRNPQWQPFFVPTLIQSLESLA